MKKMKNFLPLAAVAFAMVMTTSCSDDDDVVIINEEELITTVELELTNTADPTNQVIFTYTDIDGDGPGAAVQNVVGTINANATYEGNITFLNESVSPVEVITNEVIEEDDEHEVFYITTTAGVSITKDDADGNGNPLGVETTFSTGAAGNGNLTIVLRHLPNKPNDGTLTGAGGETDIEVTFAFNVQ
jgi:hypothetical protein